MADLRPQGLRKAETGLVNIVAVANTLLETIATGRTAKIVKIMAYHNRGADITLAIGDTVGGIAAGAFTQRLPTLRVVNGIENVWTEDEIPSYAFDAGQNIFALPSAAGAAPNDIEVLIEIEELGV